MKDPPSLFRSGKVRSAIYRVPTRQEEKENLQDSRFFYAMMFIAATTHIPRQPPPKKVKISYYRYIYILIK